MLHNVCKENVISICITIYRLVSPSSAQTETESLKCSIIRDCSDQYSISSVALRLLKTIPATQAAVWMRCEGESQEHKLTAPAALKTPKAKNTKSIQHQNAQVNLLVNFLPFPKESHFLLSRSGPFFCRLHPHTASWIIHYIHQSLGVTVALGPRVGCWFLHGTGGVMTGPRRGNLLLNANNRPRRRACTRFVM